MRRSSRAAVVMDAVRIAQEGGIDALTYEALADRAGLTRGGVVYHFPSRESLIRSVCTALAEQWESELLTALGKPFEQSTSFERARAYLVASLTPSTAQLIRVLTDPRVHGLDPRPWDAIIQRWAPPPTAGMDSSTAEADLLVMRLLADGIWAQPALAGQALSPSLHALVLQRVEDLFGTAVSDPDSSDHAEAVEPAP